MRLLFLLFLTGLLPCTSCVSWPAFHAQSQLDQDPENWEDPDGNLYRRLAEEKPADLLSSHRYRRLVFEIDAYEGCEPSDWSLLQLEIIAGRWCEKPDGIVVLRDEVISAALHPFDGTEKRVRELGLAHRNHGAGEDTLVCYILCVPSIHGDRAMGTSSAALGPDREEPNFALYHDTIAANARLHMSANELEAHTIVHEFGHQLGLTEAPRHTCFNSWPHCTRPECVMSGVTLSDGLWGNFFYNPFRLIVPLMPKSFCVECRRDLEGTKRAIAAELDPSSI